MCTEAFKSVAMRVTAGALSSAAGGTSGESKPKQAAAEEVINAARVALRAASCLICMDGGPTLSTLCCGQPIHFTCLSNWFITQRRRNHNTSVDCPHCRCDISELQIDRIAPATAVVSGAGETSDGESETSSDFDDNNDDNETSSTVDGSNDGDDSTSTTSIVADNNDNNNHDDDDDTTTTSLEEVVDTNTNTNTNDDDETSTTSVENEPPHRPQCFIQGCQNIRAGGCANDRCGRCCSVYEGACCYRHGTGLPEAHAHNNSSGDHDDTSTSSSTTSDDSLL